MRILGLDVGEKRIGVATSDELGLIAQGLKTLARKSDAKVLSELEIIVDQYQIKYIIVGLPLNMDGTEGKQTKKVRSFVEKLRKRFRKRAHVETWDERLSTIGAERALLEADLSRQKRRAVVDKMAAVFILQGYLDAKTNQAHHVETLS